MRALNRFTLAPLLCALVACASNKPAPAAPPPEPAPRSPAAAAAPQPAPVEESQPASEEADAPPEVAPSEPRKFMEIVLDAKSGSKLVGKATFAEKKDGVRVVIELSGIKPGDHGVHVHENGDCSAPDASSAGGHYNPQTHDHGLPDQEHRHLGDLGNIMIGKDGTGTHEILILGASLADSKPNSFLGRSIVVHEKKDDGGQPTGNAGKRIGCGEIK